ncbi:MAG TPA: PEP-CTERM sorting domain-containing protein [Tepidisphaeraceae bacterium]|nr:PEP-CTERM sorting domain-containing protein [Tepidisphaeraceae bacterium]
MRLTKILAGLAVLACTSVAGAATTYNGNGNTGFGGAVGTGSVTLSDDGTTLSGTWTRGAGNANDVLVLYIDAMNGGFTDTSGFTDNIDALRRAISGFNGGDRSALTFPTGFDADYAIALGPKAANFGGFFTLASGGAHTYGTNGSNGSANLSPVGTESASSYTFSIPLSLIGSPTSFDLFGTYIADSGFRSTEFVAGTATGTQGHNAFTGTSNGTYVVPEPGSLTLLALGAVGLLRRRRVA